MLGIGAVARRFQQALLERRADVARAGAGIATSCRLPVEPSMMVTVLVPVAGAVAGCASGDAADRHCLTPGRARHSCADLASAARHDRRRRRGCLGGGVPVETTATGSPPSGSSTISAQPANGEQTTAPSAPAIAWGTRIGRAKRRFFFAFWPSGALSSSPPRPQALANHEPQSQARSRIVNSSFTVSETGRRATADRHARNANGAAGPPRADRFCLTAV